MTEPPLDPACDRGAGRGRGSRSGIRHVTVLTAAAAVVSLDVHLISPFVSRAADALSHPALPWLLFALVAEITSLLASAHLQRRMLLSAGARVRMPTAVGVTYAAYAMSQSLPGGPAVSAGYTFRRLKQLGASTASAGFTVLSSSALSLVAYGLLAAAGSALAGRSSGSPFAVIFGLVVAALLLQITRSLFSRPEVLERIGLRALRMVNRVLRRAPDSGSSDLCRATGVLASIRPSGRDWAAGLSAALINWVADFMCLYASCRSVGVETMALDVIVLAYLSGMSVSGISLVPAGLGVVDAAVILVLVQNGVGTGRAAAAMVLYRVFAFAFGLLAGWAAWFANARARPVRASRGPSTTSDPDGHRTSNRAVDGAQSSPCVGGRRADGDAVDDR